MRAEKTLQLAGNPYSRYRTGGALLVFMCLGTVVLFSGKITSSTVSFDLRVVNTYDLVEFSLTPYGFPSQDEVLALVKTKTFHNRITNTDMNGLCPSNFEMYLSKVTFERNRRTRSINASLSNVSRNRDCVELIVDTIDQLYKDAIASNIKSIERKLDISKKNVVLPAVSENQIQRENLILVKTLLEHIAIVEVGWGSLHDHPLSERYTFGLLTSFFSILVLFLTLVRRAPK